MINALGRLALSSTPLQVVAALPAIDDAGRLNRLFAGGRRSAHFRYRITGTPAPGAAIEAVRMPDATVVTSWPLDIGADDEEVVLDRTWDGFVGTHSAPTGTYILRLNAAAASAASAAGAADTQFDLVEALFPIRGRHQIGTSVSQRFGGPRGHEGQDTFARCGTPLAALTKGTVQFAGFHAAAGNYVIVHERSGESYAYMHLRDGADVAKGDHVFTGQRLGYVGDTGDAQGCHLHIELWTAPGWYEGGHPYDPRAALERWDDWS